MDNTLSRILINELPNDNQYWRIFWVGYVNNNIINNHLTIEIAIAPLVIHDQLPTPKYFQHTPLIKTVDIKNHKVVHIDIGSFHLIPLGSIWKNQSLALAPAYSNQTFEVNFSKSMVSRQKIYQPIPSLSANRDYPIPKSQYPIPKSFCDTNCILVKLNEKFELIIPTNEIVRFYFFNSEKLAMALVAGDHLAIPNHVWCPRQSRKIDNQNFKVHLKKGFSHHDATTIARIAASQYALMQSAHLRRNLYIPLNRQSRKATLNCLPPFQGLSNLNVRGQMLKSATKRRFLVFEILSCTGQFPWSQLYVESESIHYDFEEKETQLRTDQTASSQDETDSISERIKIKSITLSSIQPSLLLNLKKIRIKRNKYPNENLSPPFFITTNQSINPFSKPSNRQNTRLVDLNVSTNKGRYKSNDIKRLNISIQNEPAIKSKVKKLDILNAIGFQQLVFALLALRLANKIQFTYRTFGTLHQYQGKDCQFVCVEYVKFNNETSKWGIIHNNNAERPRLALIAEVLIEDKFYYLIDAENNYQSSKSTGILTFRSSDFSYIDDDELKLILAYQIHNRSTSLKLRQLSDIVRSRLNHKVNSAYSVQSFASNIYQKFTRHLQFKPEA